MSTPREVCHLCSGSTGGCNGACRSPGPTYWSITQPPQKGCICPPTSEKTCQRWDCGRKTPSVSIGGSVLENRKADLADANTKKDPP